MESLGLWILGVAAGSFAAGMVVGHLFQPACVAAASSPEEAAYVADVVADLTSRYGLSIEQQRRLRLVVQYQSTTETAILRSTQFNQLPQPQNGEIMALRTATENRIRALLDDAQRARYDHDRLGQQPAAAKR